MTTSTTFILTALILGAAGIFATRGLSQELPDEFITIKPRRAAPGAPSILNNPTAPCRVAVGMGGSWLTGSLGLTGSAMDDGCNLRENARLLSNLGEREAALDLLCTDAGIAKVLKRCPKIEPTPAPAPAPEPGKPLY